MVIDFELNYVAILLVLFLAIRFRQVSFGRLILESVFLSYLTMVASYTLFPIYIQFEDTRFPWYHTVNFIPFATIPIDSSSIHIAKWYVGGNLIMLMPFGFLVPFIWKWVNTFRRAFIVFSYV
ncbi:VanZ family protein [Thermoactinomyces sp. DSM 45892]|uniref:VanZ family protein n=1 Tax=Thermoactinomyces sp. DSM 45892 TaxID=1882753 RepID=UPI000898078E|nr:VanZ like family protein [Thermoactinomyces sp. DSM 45892]